MAKRLASSATPPTLAGIANEFADLASQAGDLADELDSLASNLDGLDPPKGNASRPELAFAPEAILGKLELERAALGHALARCHATALRLRARL